MNVKVVFRKLKVFLSEFCFLIVLGSKKQLEKKTKTKKKIKKLNFL